MRVVLDVLLYPLVALAAAVRQSVAWHMVVRGHHLLRADERGWLCSCGRTWRSC
jgi:hypothetical protein